MSLRLPSLLGFAALLLLASSAQAQRPSSTPFIGLRGGASAYGGDIDGTSGDEEFAWLFDPLGWAVGGELGYQFSRNLAFSAGLLYGNYPAFGRPFTSPVTQQTDPDGLDGEDAFQIQGLFRYSPFTSRLVPYVTFGGSAVFGQGYETGGSRIIGYGPTLGLGLEYMLGRKLGFFLEAQTTYVFPDDAADGVDPSSIDPPLGWADAADFDNLNFYGAGFRFYFRNGTPVDATIDCATDLSVGESGTFTAYANDDATQPVEYMWDFGDGSTGMGMTASHSYAAEGTYTVSMTASGPVNSETETCLVNVRRIPQPPVLASCRVTPSRVGIGENVTVNASVSGDPATISVDFGDGSRASALPATHAYSSPGTYTISINATNGDGSDSCNVTVTVGDSFCDEVTELNTVYFDFDMSALTSDARSRLDENIEVLRRCPNVCVVINGYTDDVEQDKLRLSQRRADEARAYYVANGIAESRLRARGLGEAPDANNKEDPGPGDRNARRAESIPVDCARLDSMGR